MTITNIFLQAPAGGGGFGGLTTTLIPFLLIIVVFYFFMIRPQTKKAKLQQDFKNTLDKGEKVVTIGGIHGKIVEVKPNTFIIDTGGVRLEVEKSAISMELTKTVQKPKVEAATK